MADGNGNHQKAIDPNTTIVVIGDDGVVYKLTRDVWATSANKVADPQGLLVPNQVRATGSYIAFPPAPPGAGVGFNCTIVNLQAILGNQRAIQHAKTAAVTHAAQPSASSPGGASAKGHGGGGGEHR